MTKRKTDEEFKQEIYSLVGDEYTFLDKYVNARTKLRVKHNKCNFIYSVSPHNFLTGKRCPNCFSTPKRSDKDFKHEVNILVGDEYTFLDSYVNNKTKLRVKHNVCGNVYKVRALSFLEGSRCPYCAGLVKKTDKQFRQEVYDLVGDEYKFLDSYVNTKTKLRVCHNECGNVYEVTPSRFLSGERCPYCAGLVKKTDQQFKQEVYTLVGDEYTFLDSYVNAKTKLRVKHNKCNFIYSVAPTNFLRGSRCPHCYIVNKPKSDNLFKQEVSSLVGDEYTILDTYTNAESKIRLRHNKCGNVYKTRPRTFLQGYRCPYCNSPKGETVITKLLDTLNIDYEYQKTFPDPKDKSCLSYDFYISDQNILIEYQGIQHYQPVDHFGGDDRFINQQKHDQMKLDYAKEHGYNLIAVPYTEDTFSKIKKYLTKHGLKK